MPAKMTDRDHFAAAALTGLLAQGDDGSFSEESYARAAYRWADVMLRERTNHDAAPAARAIKNDGPPRERTRPDGTGDTPTLTEAEREAVEWAAKTLCVGWHDLDSHGKERSRNSSATLRGLLERLK